MWREPPDSTLDEGADPTEGGDRPLGPEQEDDTAAHSLSILLGVNRMARSSAERARSRRLEDQELPRLTRPWPRLRDDRRR